MRRTISFILGVFLTLAALGSSSASAKLPRSSSAKAHFMKLEPCPSTGHARGSCPGYVIDHVVPLCAGGADAPSNMQWQTIADAEVKDRAERAQCRKR